MTDERSIKEQEAADTTAQDGQQDTEGHNMWINPGSARDLTRSRELERQREMAKRQRQKDAKSK